VSTKTGQLHNPHEPSPDGAFQGPARIDAQNSPRLGYEGAGHVLVGVCQQDLGPGWKLWLSWAMRCRLEPVKKVARTIKEHLWDILNAIVLKVSNGPAEGLNSWIKALKIRIHGFRNKQRFANAIYFHPDGLNPYPEGGL